MTFGMVLAVSWSTPFLDTTNGSMRKGWSAIGMGNVGSKRLVLLYTPLNGLLAGLTLLVIYSGWK